MAVSNKELIRSLLEGFRGLAYRDEARLNELRTRGKMIVRKVFGDSSDNYKDFLRIGFHPMWAPSTEVDRQDLWTSGQNESVNLLTTMLEELELSEVPEVTEGLGAKDEKSNRIFVVHGHDDEMRLAVARSLEKLKLDPVILHEQPDRGRTIIEKFTDYSDVGFAVVLLSPDDMGYRNAQSPSEARPRARQNVILELGYFLGKLGRENVLVLYRQADDRQADDLEFPSDYSGVLYTPFEEGKWQFGLVRELKACGYAVTADALV